MLRRLCGDSVTRLRLVNGAGELGRSVQVGRVPSDAALAAMIAFLILALALFGALESLPEWVRGIAQAIGTLAGIYLGARFQYRDQRRLAEGAAKSSIQNLFALAKSVRALLDSLENTRSRLRESAPRSVDSFQQSSERIMEGVDAHSRAILAQAEAAAAAWAPFLRADDPLLRRLDGDTSDRLGGR